LSGFLPTGMSYELGGDYADSYGVRNFENFDSYNLWAGIAVRQPLLRNFWIDQGRLLIRITKKNLKITELGVHYMVMNVINQVHQAYYDLVFARENLRVEEKLLEVRQRFDAETKQQVRVGRLPSLDEKLAESQVAQVQAGLLTARNAVALAENQLKTLLGDDFVSSVGVSLMPADRLVVVPGVFELQQSWQEGLADRPDLAQMRIDLEKADLDLKYRKNQLYPGLDLVAGYGRRGSSTRRASPPDSAVASLTGAFEQVWDGIAPNDMIGVIFSVPLSRAKERANYRGSRELREQLQLRIKQREELALREIDDALKTAMSNLDRVSATHKAAEYAKAAVEAEQVKLAAGRSTPYVVLQLQGDMATAESTECLARAEYLKSLSQLHFAEGSTLQKNGIVLELK
jgi:HAE1 family hydrophobic/amphiphilic exporter-1